MILYSDNQTQSFENKRAWIQNITYVKTKWAYDKNNLSLFLKLSVTVWYTLTLDGPELSLTRNEYADLTEMLYQCYGVFISLFSNDNTCQWIFGYMMTVSPLFFMKTKLSYNTIEETGKKLIKQASDNGDMIAKLLNTLDKISCKDIYKYQIFIKEQINEYFDASQEIDRYFIEILTIAINNL